VSRDPSGLGPLRRISEANGWQLEMAGSGWEALERVQWGPSPGLVLLDLTPGDTDGLYALRWLRRVRPDLPIVLLSYSDHAQQEAEAIRLGAQDYLVRPLDERHLELAVKRYMGAETVCDEIEQISGDMFFVAASPAMRKLRAQVELLAQVNEPILIVGESGSGKEISARLIHKLSVRSGFRFLKVNCAALPGDLLESELFGSERAFTGNGLTKLSKFEQCEKGTLFLNDITEMPLGLQAKLVQVLQDGYFFRLGGEKRIKVDIRILTATDADTEQAIAQRKLREDLYYRLSALTVHVPSLRQRKEEIPLLLGHFMNQFANYYALPPRTFSPALLDACQRYLWPGNLKELQSFVKRYLVMGSEPSSLGELERSVDSPLQYVHSPQMVEPSTGTSIPTGPQERVAGLKSLAQSAKGEAERNAIATALGETHWNRKAAAQVLQISYRTLLYKIEQYRMNPPPNQFPGSGNGGGLKGNRQGT